MEVVREPSWRKVLREEFEQPYVTELTAFIEREYEAGTVYPRPKHIFHAFELTPFNAVRVVILGQDPYHGAGQAHGLSFSVSEGVRNPPSLRNMFEEIESDIGEAPDSANGNLERWAKQGVLLLNATLTVRANTPGSHQGKGWERFTDAVIKKVSDEREHVVFILWGNYARSKKGLIDTEKHCVIESPHPSPFSAQNGFFGSKPFSRANACLRVWGEEPIDWR